MDVSSAAYQVSRNLIYDVSYAPIVWNVNPGTLPTQGPTPTRISNNVLIADRDNSYYQGGANGTSTRADLCLSQDRVGKEICGTFAQYSYFIAEVKPISNIVYWIQCLTTSLLVRTSRKISVLKSPKPTTRRPGV